MLSFPDLLSRVTFAQPVAEPEYFQRAANAAMRATCESASCGTVIVSEGGRILGEGFNGPPDGDLSQSTCRRSDWGSADKPLYDRTCCIHAEWRALNAAMKHSDRVLRGATLYFMRISSNGSWTFAGDPYCTVCSRLILEAGIARVALWGVEGSVIYTAQEFNEASYNYYARESERSIALGAGLRM